MAEQIHQDSRKRTAKNWGGGKVLSFARANEKAKAMQTIFIRQRCIVYFETRLRSSGNDSYKQNIFTSVRVRCFSWPACRISLIETDVGIRAVDNDRVRVLFFFFSPTKNWSNFVEYLLKIALDWPFDKNEIKKKRGGNKKLLKVKRTASLFGHLSYRKIDTTLCENNWRNERVRESNARWNSRFLFFFFRKNWSCYVDRWGNITGTRRFIWDQRWKLKRSSCYAVKYFYYKKLIDPVIFWYIRWSGMKMKLKSDSFI